MTQDTLPEGQDPHSPEAHSVNPRRQKLLCSLRALVKHPSAFAPAFTFARSDEEEGAGLKVGEEQSLVAPFPHLSPSPLDLTSGYCLFPSKEGKEPQEASPSVPALGTEPWLPPVPACCLCT